MLNCTDDSEKACSPMTSCASEFAEILACVREYCDSNPDDALCEEY